MTKKKAKKPKQKKDDSLIAAEVENFCKQLDRGLERIESTSDLSERSLLFENDKKTVEKFIAFLKENKPKVSEENKKEFEIMIKNLNQTLKYIKEGQKEIEKTQKAQKEAGPQIICPYCKKQFLIDGTKTSAEYTCSECEKTFLGIMGTVLGARGLGGYVAHQAVIRVQNKEGGIATITYYAKYQGSDIFTGDFIAAIYKKGALSGEYGTRPAIIQNFTQGTYTTKL